MQPSSSTASASPPSARATISSVATRARSEDDLVALALPRLRALAAHGTTTVEVKSGYGLSLDAELKTLRVIRRLGQLLPLRIVPTFLGAHEIPLEARAREGGAGRLREVHHRGDAPCGRPRGAGAIC